MARKFYKCKNVTKYPSTLIAEFALYDSVKSEPSPFNSPEAEGWNEFMLYVHDFENADGKVLSLAVNVYQDAVSTFGLFSDLLSEMKTRKFFTVEQVEEMLVKLGIEEEVGD